jgi:hypothetical protein
MLESLHHDLRFALYQTGPVGAWTVVGVVGDVRHKTLGAPVEPTMYRTVTQAPMRRLYLVTRTAGDPAAVSQAVQRAIWTLDPDTPITEAGVMKDLMRNSEADDWFRAVVMGVRRARGGAGRGRDFRGDGADGGAEGDGDGDPFGTRRRELVFGGARRS